MLGNQGLLAITFFEATAFIVLLVLFFLFRRDHPASYFRLWLNGLGLSYGFVAIRARVWFSVKRPSCGWWPWRLMWRPSWCFCWR